MRTSLLLILFIYSLPSFAQRIKLTKTATGKVQYLNAGDRIQFLVRTARLSAYPRVRSSIGKIQKITADTVTVGTDRIAFADIGAIGRRRSGSGFAAYVCGFMAGALIISGVAGKDNDPCPTCQTAPGSDTGSSSKIVSVIGGLAFAGLAINNAVRNSPRNLNKWTLEVVE
jgi:hypothetical protein